jgi:2-oxoisovalerate dehydrogenase E1 component
MPKSLVVDPQQVRKAGKLKSREIPLNSYRPDVAKERARYGDAALRTALQHMLLIREFETALNTSTRGRRTSRSARSRLPWVSA